MKIWEEEVRDRFGPIPKEGQHLITAARIKLFGAQNFLTKVTVRADRMWLKCPKSSSEIGEEFYGTRFQPMLKALQEHAEDRFKIIQKEERVRFVIYDIADIKAAASFLKMLTAETVGSEQLPVQSE
ncbi:MAG: TRCF domain-containing protein [Balneolaceae bacterium]|nr:TRCF domain-containing protein [Balneolaceae bacterium]